MQAIRSAARPLALSARFAATAPRVVAAPVAVRFAHSAAESYDDFNARYADFFANTQDLFELQRGLNNCFAYDLVPSQRVIEEALRAARRVNDFSTAVRVFEGLKEKTENAQQYKQYVDELKPIRDELGIALREELYGSK
ncbi:putative Cytochrome-c oxidase [Rhodotorula taiwanensis]|uniref:Cytochrome c oxidase subunit 6, mitochondrial n=1 Tax=Rhodotorula taiwanensis TaxID=741276 RepID=A0A2S5B8J7_9BASI|nr:putative Cytochrome-c oxidase [Rhodotorula taiwanensis]